MRKDKIMKNKIRKCIISGVLTLTVVTTTIPVMQPMEVMAKSKYVYVTGTSYGKKYHKKSCRTIKNSKKIKMTRKRAKKLH